MELTQDVLVSLLAHTLFYFTIGSFGAFIKDLHESLTGKIKRVRIGTILVGGAVSTFTCLFIQDYFSTGLGINTMVFLAFLFGVLGFEIFGNANLKRVAAGLRYANKYKKGFFEFLDYMKEADSKESEGEGKKTSDTCREGKEPDKEKKKNRDT